MSDVDAADPGSAGPHPGVGGDGGFERLGRCGGHRAGGRRECQQLAEQGRDGLVSGGQEGAERRGRCEPGQRRRAHRRRAPERRPAERDGQRPRGRNRNRRRIGRSPHSLSAPSRLRVWSGCAATSALNSSNKGVTATCPSGKRLLGLGADLNTFVGQLLLDDLPPTRASPLSRSTPSRTRPATRPTGASPPMRCAPFRFRGWGGSRAPASSTRSTTTWPT